MPDIFTPMLDTTNQMGTPTPGRGPQADIKDIFADTASTTTGTNVSTDGGGKAAQAIAFARQALGTPYRYGGTDPQNGIDCSGLIQWAYKQVGIDLPRVTYDQVNAGVAVDPTQMQPGDLVFSQGDIGMRHFGHVGIYIGNGQIIVAPHTGDVVKIAPLPSHVEAVRRVV